MCHLWSDFDVKKSATYHYRVSAYNKAGESPYSQPVTIRVSSVLASQAAERQDTLTTVSAIAGFSTPPVASLSDVLSADDDSQF